MGYKILEIEKIPESLRNKPRWVSCVAFTAAVLTITVSAISIGVLLGYTYCYIEHSTAVRTGNVSQSANLQMVHMSYPDTEEAKYNRTINGALMSSVMMSRILKIGQAMMDDNVGCIPFSENDHSADMGL